VVGNRGSVVESDFYAKLKKLDVQEGKKDKLFANHVTQVCGAHNQVIVSFLQQVQEIRRKRKIAEVSRIYLGFGFWFVRRHTASTPITAGTHASGA